MNNCIKIAILAITAMVIAPGIAVKAFEQDDLNQLKTSRICNNACDLSRADLSEVYLVKANLENANLRGAYLNEVNLNNAFLNRADLSEADLGGSYLRDATLQQANLSEARLSRADFKGVVLNQANIKGTHLIAAKNLTATQIKSACNWKLAIYDRNDDSNQKFIKNLKRDKASNPERRVDCSIWN